MSAKGGSLKGDVREAILFYLIFRPWYREQNFKSAPKSGVNFRIRIYKSDSQSTQSVQSIAEAEKAASGAQKSPNAWSDVGVLSSNSVCLGAPCRSGPYRFVQPLLRQGFLSRVSTDQNPVGRPKIALSSLRLEMSAINPPKIPLATSMISSKRVDLSQWANYVNAGMSTVPSSFEIYDRMVDFLGIWNCY